MEGDNCDHNPGKNNEPKRADKDCEHVELKHIFAGNSPNLTRQLPFACLSNRTFLALPELKRNPVIRFSLSRVNSTF